jgi:lipopolysaccharide/colanic/teichoic acid biosynthesis glycosyltransferase
MHRMTGRRKAVSSRSRSWRSSAKRAADLLLAGLGLLVTAPLFALIALAVTIQDGGPVLFRQVRLGRNGQPFTILKFRSMVTDAEDLKAGLITGNEGADHLFKLADDPRVTRVGRVLRRWSLDELPQLVNVLTGAMSLVGPRPHLAAEVARMPRYAARRSLVKPGLTGLWQVSGRSDLDEAQSMRLDLRYVDSWSLGLDARITLRTVAAVLTGRGAH